MITGNNLYSGSLNRQAEKQTFGDQCDLSLKKKKEEENFKLPKGEERGEGTVGGCKGQLIEALVYLSDKMVGENDQLLSDIFIRDNVSEVECYVKAWVGNMAFTCSHISVMCEYISNVF